jgi:hypothetical protein
MLRLHSSLCYFLILTKCNEIRNYLVCMTIPLSMPSDEALRAERSGVEECVKQIAVDIPCVLPE